MHAHPPTQTIRNMIWKRKRSKHIQSSVVLTWTKGKFRSKPSKMFENGRIAPTFPEHLQWCCRACAWGRGWTRHHLCWSSHTADLHLEGKANHLKRSLCQQQLCQCRLEVPNGPGTARMAQICYSWIGAQEFGRTWTYKWLVTDECQCHYQEPKAGSW